MTPRTIHLPKPPSGLSRSARRRWAFAVTVPLVVALVALVSGMRPAAAADAPVGLGTTASFAVLGATTVTNTGASVLNGDLGLYAGTSITGFPPGIVNGATHTTDSTAQQAQSDLVIAYNDAASRGPGTAASVLDGRTLTGGVYTGTTQSLGVSGTVTLDAQNDPNAVFIFQSASTLITGSNSKVALVNGAQACNVFWQVGSSATLGTNTTFVGTVMALTSISAQTGTTVQGRLLARNGAVTLDDNVITTSTCSIATGTTTSSPPVTTTNTTTPPETTTTTTTPVTTTSTTTPPETTTSTTTPVTTTSTTTPVTTTSTTTPVTTTSTTTPVTTTSTTTPVTTTSTTTPVTTTSTTTPVTTTSPTSTITATFTGTTTAPVTTTTAPSVTTTTTTAPSVTTTTTTAPVATSTTTAPVATTRTTAPVVVPAAGAPQTGDTGAELPASPLNAVLALGLFAAAGAIALRLGRRTGRH